MEIKNETIKKLTMKELNDLCCGNIGIYTYKGVLKTRTKEFFRTQVDDKEFWFESKNGSSVKFEFIKLADEVNEPQWAVRRVVKDKYEMFWPVLWGCDFVK